uniref:Transposase n=1 Tax=Panagrellus redivivus TaxID=6233 RepID=A0A7E4VTT8_PANRE
MDTSDSNPNASEDHTAQQYEGFVHIFEKRAYVLNACRAINRPLKSKFRHIPGVRTMEGYSTDYRKW